MERLYEEDPHRGDGYREKALAELNDVMARRIEEAREARHAYFAPDFSSCEAYWRTTEPYRQQYKQMLGWPICPLEPAPEGGTEEIFVAEDDLGAIYRLRIPVMEGLCAYGILFLPKGNGPFPLVITQHGGLGTPERVGGFFGSANYNDMVRRVLRRGAACFAPQLYLWSKDYGPDMDRAHREHQLKMLGGSFAALETLMIMRSVDALCRKPQLDSSRVGMLGLSYGGLYTLLVAAADPRIRVACSSCAFHDPMSVKMSDWGWFDSVNRFTFVEIAKLICPRALYIEVADADELFDCQDARLAAPEVRDAYERLGIAREFCFSVFSGVHELSHGPQIVDFLMAHLQKE